MRTLAAILIVGGALGLTACGDGDASPTATPRVTASATTVTRSATAAAPSTTSATSTPAPSATGTAPPTGESGVEGMVTIGPTCPVERADSPCPDRPFEATILVLDARGRQVAEARSGADGRFRVTLPPGEYTLRPESGATLPRASEQTVTVGDGRYTQVLISYDSGIR